MPKAVFTIVSSNYLHYARTLLQGAAEHLPDCERICVLVDRDPSHALAFADEFSVVQLDEIGLPDPARFTFRYSILELNTAIKPWAFAWLFDKGYSEVVYLDPDIRLYRPIDEVFALLEGGADIVVTPHLLAPMTDDKTPSELHIRVAGSYNLGFCALANRANARSFIDWWQAKLVHRCVVDFAAGIFVDQSWIDLVPGMFDNVAILRHPGYNVAYWNLAQRTVANGADGWTAAGQPLVFFHFSGFDAEASDPFSKHQDRFTLDTIGEARVLAADYAAALIDNGARTLKAIPYGYGTFDDGTGIPDFVRQAYRNDERLRASMGDDPFAHASVLGTTLPPSRPGHLPITIAMRSMWDGRPDVRATFPLTTDESVVHFHEWFANEGAAFLSAPLRAEHAALRASLVYMIDSIVPAPGEATPTVGARDLVTPRGWFVHEPDIAAAGIWVTPDAGLPCIVANEATLVVEGTYLAELIERGTGSPACELTVELDGSAIATARLETGGRFVLHARGPSTGATSVSELRFRCSSHFVPLAIGLGDDARQLAWRAHRITLGDEVLLDAARNPAVRPIDAVRAVDGVNLVGYLSAESGIGESLRSFARACNAVGLRCSTYDVGHQSPNRQHDRSLQSLVVTRTVHRIDVLHVNADQTRATLAELPPSHRDADIRIGYWHWEQPELPISFLPSFEGLTEVWVPSGFVHDAVASISPVPVFKVPHAIGFSVPAAMDRASFELPSDRFLVLTMYDFDSYQVRKNPQAAIDAYRLACGTRDDCALVVKTINGDRNVEARSALRDALADLPGVHWIDRYLFRDEVYALENACDCFVSLHRSEGFGLGLAEMMYLGKPVLGTGWSGNMEFMTPMNSFPIDYVLKPLEHSVGVYEAAQPWAEADVGHAAHVLRQLIDDADLRSRIGQRAASDMRQLFSPARIGSRYLGRLGLLAMRGRSSQR